MCVSHCSLLCSACYVIDEFIESTAAISCGTGATSISEGSSSIDQCFVIYITDTCTYTIAIELYVVNTAFPYIRIIYIFSMSK
jgi:hypothetical protein